MRGHGFEVSLYETDHSIGVRLDLIFLYILRRLSPFPLFRLNGLLGIADCRPAIIP